MLKDHMLMVEIGSYKKVKGSKLLSVVSLLSNTSYLYVYKYTYLFFSICMYIHTHVGTLDSKRKPVCIIQMWPYDI